MSNFIIWNPISKSRRYLSENSCDYSLGILLSYLGEKGHKFELVDWQRDDFFTKLSPSLESFWIRKLYSEFMDAEGVRKCVLDKLVEFLRMRLGNVQQGRLNKEIEHLAKDWIKSNPRVLIVRIKNAGAFLSAKYMLSKIKPFMPDIITIAAGPYTTLYEGNVLEYGDFDFGVTCDDALTLERVLALAQAYIHNWNKQSMFVEFLSLIDKGELSNFIYRKVSLPLKTERRDLSPVLLSGIPKYNLSENKLNVYLLHDSFGCGWGKCNFCVKPHFFSDFVLREPNEVVSEIEALRKQGLGIFRFAGSDTPLVFLSKIADKLTSKKIRVAFQMDISPIRGAKNMYTSLVAYFAVLITAGLKSVSIGADSGNDEINSEVMNKEVTIEDIIYTAKALHEAQGLVESKVFITLTLIFPPPLFHKVTLYELKQQNMTLLRAVAPDSFIAFMPTLSFHTKWYENNFTYGFELGKSKIMRQLMEYEYTPEKPLELWEEQFASLDRKPFAELLEECIIFRREASVFLGIPAGISAEEYFMFYCCGIRDKKDILKAKNDIILDIISGSYHKLHRLCGRVNVYSATLAAMKE